jgi:hypothetical protein
MGIVARSAEPGCNRTVNDWILFTKVIVALVAQIRQFDRQ